MRPQGALAGSRGSPRLGPSAAPVPGLSALTVGGSVPTKERLGGGRDFARQILGDNLDLSATGSWTAEHARTLEPLVERCRQQKASIRSVAIDVAHIERLDTYGAWLIERALRAWSSQGCETRMVGLLDHDRGLFEKIQAGTHKLSPEPRGRKQG